MGFSNVYEDAERAEAYSKLEFPGTYYLAYRDLPKIIRRYVRGRKAVDFGCGTGRSTRFLEKLGFDVVGVDVSEDMLKKARELDPKGDYRLTKDDDFSQFEKQAYDLVLSVFTFDNIPTMQNKVKIFTQLGRLLRNQGRIIKRSLLTRNIRARMGIVLNQGFSREQTRKKRRHRKNNPDRHRRQETS